MPTIEERFWDKVNKTDSCWDWTASVDRFGYGKLTITESKNKKRRRDSNVTYL